jgi:hypothetical protein
MDLPTGSPDLFDAESLQGSSVDLNAVRNRPSRKPPRHGHGEPFLKGPIPWGWLEQAMQLPGKALQVALVLWRNAGCKRNRTVKLCLSGKLPGGLNEQSARRGLRSLSEAGLVSISRQAGRGLEVTLNDQRPSCDRTEDLQG